jgi:hypothetical protein
VLHLKGLVARDSWPVTGGREKKSTANSLQLTVGEEQKRHTRRCMGKSAEVVDKKEVPIAPLRKRVRKLNEIKEIDEVDEVKEQRGGACGEALGRGCCWSPMGLPKKPAS